MARRTIDLTSYPWRMGQAPRRPFDASPTNDRDAVAEWLPARVPGDVRADLIAAGRIPPVETPEGIAASAWVDDRDWWYCVSLPDGITPDETIVLEADGIDYQSAIWLDDELLATHTGAFARQAIPLPPMQEDRSHELSVRIWGNNALPRLPDSAARRAIRRLVHLVSPGIEYFPDRMATTKAQFSFGWDFSPRLLSAGIWDDIRLVRARGAYIEDLWVCPEPASAADPTPVTWRLRLRVARWQPGAVRAEVSIRPENFDGGGADSAGRTVQLCPNDAPLCTDDYDLSLEMASARRWWPWDQGEPCLYRVTVRLRDRRGVLDEISEVTGIRQAKRGELPGGAQWRFAINGRPVFLRGANWAPVDVLPGRVTSADYNRLLGQARAAGINFLRVWGGGVREKRAFWEACDRLGILAWQEFPLACAFLDYYPRDAAYLNTLEAEARGTVRLLRNHPSLLAWCGGNEINPERESAPLARLARVAREEDPGRPWIPASPSAGDVHDWSVWHGYADWATLADVPTAFLSEFGMQAVPVAHTLAEMFPNGIPASPDDPGWEARLAQTRKLAFYAAPAITADTTQRVQAAALQAGIEACRLRREPLESVHEDDVAPRCGGVAFWQLNEPWPAVSWSVIDHAGRPKAAYAMLRCAYQPLLIAARFPRRAYVAGETLVLAFWVVNDTPEPLLHCCAGAVLDGQPIWAAEGIYIRAGAAQLIGSAEVTLAASPQTLELTLACGETAPTRNRYDLAAPRPAGPPPPLAALIQRLGRRLIGSR